MKKRSYKGGPARQLISVECRGYLIGEEVKFAPDHQTMVLVDKFHLQWPQCMACYRAAYKIFASKNFSVLTKIKRPKPLRDANIIVNFLNKELKEMLGVEPEARVVAHLLRKANALYVQELNKFYSGE